MTATMYEKKDRKKFPWLLALLVLSISMLVGGIYLLINGDYSLIKKTFTYDKYSDVISLCNEDKTDNTKPTFSCKALLTNITPGDEDSSCFDVQIITFDNNLKTITICGKRSTLFYTNDILSYKKLMPIDIVFTYSLAKSSIFKDEYTFSNVSFTKMDENYIEEIVNKDIANLVTFDPNSTTIKNSVDFCPNPNNLPDYVTDENQMQYKEFFNKNILSKEEYLNNSFNQLDDYTITKFLICQSSQNIGYSGICNMSTNENMNLSKSISALQVSNTSMNWNLSFDEQDIEYLKEISLIYDNLYLINNSNNTYINKINSLIYALNVKNNLNSSLICTIANVFKTLSLNNETALYNYNYIVNLVGMNALNNTSPLCDNLLSSNINRDGLYLRNYIERQTSNTNFNILFSCYNLNNLVNAYQ